MRRRQAYHILGQPEKPVELAVEEPKQIEKPIKKGYCKVCGVYIGRGIAFHEKKCKG